MRNGPLLGRVIGGACISLTLLVVIHVFYVDAKFGAVKGSFPLDAAISSSVTPLTIFFGTLLGIITSLGIVQYAQNHSSANIFGDVLNKRGIFTAFMLAPLLVASFYDQLSQLNSGWLVFSLSYQNGYFWESVATAVRK